MPVKWVHRVNTFINISLPFTVTLFTGFDSPRHLPVVRKRERNSLSFSVGTVFQDVNMYYLDTSCVEFPSYHHCLVIAESEWTNHCRWILFENPELHAAVKPAVIPFVGYKIIPLGSYCFLHQFCFTLHLQLSSSYNVHVCRKKTNLMKEWSYHWKIWRFCAKEESSWKTRKKGIFFNLEQVYR